MWTKQQPQTESASTPSAPPVKPAAVALNSPSMPVLGSTPAKGPAARIGSGLQIKGQITGTEDLQIDGKVDGPISLRGHGLTVGAGAELTSEIHAREVIVYGKVVGNVHARDRVDVKGDGSVVGDISTARISIEDGAQFKGRIEIDPTKPNNAAN